MSKLPQSAAADIRPAPVGAAPLLPRLFAALFGAFLGLALLKFGNPPIMEKYVVPPANGWELLLFTPWPIAWAYALLGVVTLVGVLAACWEILYRRSRRDEAQIGEAQRKHQNLLASAATADGLKAPRWLIALPLLWLLWQCLATWQALDLRLARPTLAHFAACVVCFYLGLLSLGRARSLTAFWSGLIAGFLLLLAVGWEQHFGGLEQTRRYFYQEIYPALKEVPPEYLKKINSNRVFSTLFYPNALAGALLLLLPVMLGLVWNARALFTAAARRFLAVLFALPALACLHWSGSKGGWLLMLLLGLVALLRPPLGRRIRIALVAAVLLAGLAGFFWEYSAFFQKGATSVGARFDYWQAALRTTAAHPVFGTGPGTFALPYRAIKRPESEMSRLVHNDYLEQATDSGLPGCAAYAVFIVAALGVTFRRSRAQAVDWLTFTLWLGLFGWALQGLVEFGLYLPALAWPAFALLGLLLARTHPRS